MIDRGGGEEIMGYQNIKGSWEITRHENITKTG